jgi:protease IV
MRLALNSLFYFTPHDRGLAVSTIPQPEGQPQPQTPMPAQVVPGRYLPPPPPRRGFWGRFFLGLFTLIFVGSILLNLLLLGLTAVMSTGGDSQRKVNETYFSGNYMAPDKVAIISVEGIILDVDDGFVKHEIDRAMEDEHVKAVVLRVDSPGGTVTGSDYIYHHLRELVEKREIPIVVSMGGMAASGGYYVSMAAGQTPGVIFAEPTTTTGSIGVVMPHYNLAGLMEKYGVESDAIASHPLKTMGSMSRPMTDDEKKIFQALVDDNFTRFKEIVRSGREKFDADPAKLDKLATGQVYTANQALKNGLIDKIGFIEDAVDHAITLAKLDPEKVKVVRYKPEASLRAVLFGANAEAPKGFDLQALLDMTTPRAYYLCTGLPGLEGVGRP